MQFIASQPRFIAGSRPLLTPAFVCAIASRAALLTAFTMLAWATSTAHAADGTWIQTTAGPFDWGTAGNWSGSVVANGADFTAFFTPNISANETVNLATPQTIGNITFTDSTTSSHNLTISGANALTLDVTADLPIIDVTQSGRTLTISSQIAGNDGLQKNGVGTLSLTGTKSYTGTTSITGGILSFDATAKTVLEQAGGIMPISLTNGGRLQISSSNVASTSEVSVGAGGGQIMVNGNNNFTTTGKLTGSGTLTHADPGGAGGRSLNFNATNNDFTGGIIINGANALTVSVNSLLDAANNIVFNNNGTNNGTNGFTYGATAIAPLTLNSRALEINSNNTHTTTITNNNATHALTINTDLIATGSGGKQLTLSAANGPINVFAGDITNGSGGGTMALLHNSGNWELTGNNTYSGDTLVNVTLTMRGTAAVSPNTKFRLGGTDGSAGNSDTIRIFTDDAGTVNLGNQLDLRSVQTSATANWGVNVGNNGGATTGSTIALGKVNFAFTTDNRANGLIFNTTGTNGYKVQVGDIDVSINQANSNRLNPTTAPLTVTGTVKQISGKAGPYTANGVDVTYRADYFELDGTASGNLISGVITDATDFTNASNPNARPLNIVKRNTSTWTLSNTNTYSGATYVNGGTLIVNDIQNGGIASSIGESSNAPNMLVLGSGTLQYTPINSLGAAGSTTDRNFLITGNATIDSSGAGALIFNQTGTISPDITGLTGTRTAGSGVITGLASTANLAIGMVVSGTGIPAGRTIATIDSATQISLNSGTSVTAASDGLNFGYGNRTLTLTGTNVDANTVAGDLQNSTAAGAGVLTLTKSGVGRWVLSGDNTYNGTTTINAGVLQAVDGMGLPTASLLQLRGGVLQSSGTFTRTVTTSAGGVNWSTSSGGFAAIDAPLILNLNGGTGSLTWNGSSMVQTGQTLIFGSTSADNLVDFQNGLNLGSSGSGQRTIQVDDNPLSSTDRARISGAITNTVAGWGILKTGNGTLELTNANTYTGTTTVSAGTLLANNTTGSATGTGLVSVSAGATLGGDGAVGGDTTIFGTHAPGNSPGVIEHLSSLNYDGGASTVEWELVDNTITVRGIDFDGIDVATNLTFTAATTLDLIFDSSGSTVDWTDPFWQVDHLGTSGWLVYDVGGTTSNFANLSISAGPFLDSLGNPSFGDFSLLQSGSDIYLNYNSPFTAVPEPVSLVVWTLLGLGLAVCGAYRRKRKV